MLGLLSANECTGGVALTRRQKNLQSVELSRREFLSKLGQGASFAFLPAELWFPPFPSSFSDQHSSPSAEFHLHPQYRSQRELDNVFRKVHAGFNDFVTEKYQDQIAALFKEWSSHLLEFPQNTTALARVMGEKFVATSPEPILSQATRGNSSLKVSRLTFAEDSLLTQEVFLEKWRSSMSVFSKLFTAEFQVTSIQIGTSPRPSFGNPNFLETRVRFELIGTGADFFREQRVGNWAFGWDKLLSGELRCRYWKMLDETRSRSLVPVFADIAPRSFGGNPSFSKQLVLGTDHWRTVLDGACGIDIYGHNGVCVGDIDGGGLDDLYICQPAGLPNRLYRNRGDGTFEDITEASGVGILENTACALFVDIDNDGRPDLIVVRTSGPLLFLNQGGGKFRQKPGAFQFAKPPQGTFTGAAVADHDRDGWLDIYFYLYLYYQGTDQYKYPSPYYAAENGPPNFLMRNNRDGTFRDATAETGLNQNNTRYSFCCGWSDFNRDGWPDLYVVNDFGRKNLYRNNGNGTFTDIAPQAGVEDVGAGMSVCWFDYDNDGAEDLYVADMWSAAGKRISMQGTFQKDAPQQVRALYQKHATGNSLFRNGSDGTFQNTGAAAGVEMGGWSWSSDAWDFDHDGFPDLYVANGMISGPMRPTREEALNSFFWRQVVANSPAEAKPSPDYEQGWAAINELVRSDGTWSGFERNVFYANNRDG